MQSFICIFEDSLVSCVIYFILFIKALSHSTLFSFCQVTKLAQVYKLRYRFNKTRAQASTTYLIKARYILLAILISETLCLILMETMLLHYQSPCRQTTMPASGEVDLILNSFADMR